MMRLSEVLEAEWRPAFGCTEPAAVAWAASMAAEQARGEGPIEQVRLVVDPRTYKNCYAVGIHNSEHRTGILWALAIGYAVWGEVPNTLALAGIAVIVGSGLYILHRERVRR